MFTLSEFCDYAGISAEAVDSDRLNALKREAVVVLRSYVRDLPENVDDWPEAAKIVSLRVVSRGYLQADSGLPFGATSVSYGAEGYSHSYGFSDNSSGSALWLSKQDKALLRGLGGGARAYGLDMTQRAGLRRDWGPDPWEVIN